MEFNFSRIRFEIWLEISRRILGALAREHESVKRVLLQNGDYDAYRRLMIRRHLVLDEETSE